MIDRIEWPRDFEADAGVAELRARWSDVIGDDLIVVRVPSIRVGRETVARALRGAAPAWFTLVSERAAATSTDAVLARMSATRDAEHNVRVIDLVAHDDAQQQSATDALVALNFARDQVFRDGLPTFVLIESAALPWFSTTAPDLWSFCASTCEVTATPVFRPPFVLPISVGKPVVHAKISGRNVDLDALAEQVRHFERASKRQRAGIAQLIMVNFVQHLALAGRGHDAQAALEVLYQAARSQIDEEAPSWSLVEYGLWAARVCDRFGPSDPRVHAIGRAATLGRASVARGAPANIVHRHALHLRDVARAALCGEEYELASELLDEAASLVEATSFPSSDDIAELSAAVALFRGEPALASSKIQSVPVFVRREAASDEEALRSLWWSADRQMIATQAAMCAGAYRAASNRLRPLVALVREASTGSDASGDLGEVRAKLLLTEQLLRWTLGDPVERPATLIERARLPASDVTVAFRAACEALDAVSLVERGESARDAWSRAFDLLSSRPWSRRSAHERWFLGQCANEIGAVVPPAPDDGSLFDEEFVLLSS